MAAPLTMDELCKAFAPLARCSRVALAVSGGPDSLAALHLIARWWAEGGARPDLIVLTVDHGLRAGSRAEALLVAREAAGLGLPHAILDWSRAAPVAGGVQARAREARYDLMASYCHAHDIPTLVTAHQLDDQAETFLMRLRRGSGLDGLAAIPAESSWAGIAVLRPLLGVTKSRLAATLHEAGIAFAEDPSNTDPRFERSALRGSCDALAQLGLAPAALARSAERLRRARAALDAVTSDFLAAHGAMSEAGFCLIGREALAAAPDEIALRALARTIAAVGGRSEPIRLAKLEALLAGLGESPGKTRTLGGCRLQPLGQKLGVFREVRGAGLPALRLLPGERALWDNRFRVALGAATASPVTVRALGEAGWRERVGAEPWLAALPRHAGVTLPACWRGEEMIFLPTLGLAEPAARFGACFVNASSPGAHAAKSAGRH
jgi:tRNA(Ile)-lysidine synthase